jgi:hypothetical protein
MNLIELKQKLVENRVPKAWYSLDEGLKPDACILFKNYSVWEYFYLDERGGRNDLKFFKNEEEAFDFLWQQMESELKTFGSQLSNQQYDI